MSSFAKLLEVIGDNEEAVAIAKGLQQNSETLTKEVNRLELVANEATDKRNRMKSLIKTHLGVDEISEDSLKKFSEGAKGGDEKSQAEIENLKRQLAEVAGSKESVEKTYREKIQAMNLEREISGLGLKDQVIPSKLDYLNFRMKQGISFDNEGNPVFLNEDGTTKYFEGRPMTLRDRYQEVLNSEPDLFKPDVKNGSGGTGNPGGTGGKSFSEMSEAEKVALYRQNPEKYRQLAAANNQ